MSRDRAVIRDAREEDLDAAGEIIAAANVQYAPDIAPELFDEYIRASADVRSRLAESELIVAEVDGRLVGTVTFYPAGTGDRQAPWPDGWTGIRLLAVAPDARGTGIGRLLTEECIRRSRLRGARVVGLHTADMMRVARAMYERMGFVRAPEFDFSPTPDLLVMSYRLDLGPRGADAT